MKPQHTLSIDENRDRNELLYELHLQRLENLRLQDRLREADRLSSSQRQLKYLEHTALIDETIRSTTDLDEMMNGLMAVVRAIFACDQAWLLHPCDPNATFWKVPYRSVNPEHPIHFGPDVQLAVTEDLAENTRLALRSGEPLPLGLGSEVKDVPAEAGQSAAKSALLIALHPKVGRPWLMGLHQCSSDRVWTIEEKRMFQDISSRVADALSSTLFYRDMERNQARLKHLSAQLFKAQEAERKRIAEEIHDELGQATQAVKVAVENALYAMGDGPDPVQRSLASASRLTTEIIEKMRRMQTALYPPTLRDFGVITALNGFLDDFANIYGLKVERSIQVTEAAIPERLRAPLFRVAQEALYNAGQHSRADTVTVAMDRVGTRLLFEVGDNGVGFDPAIVLRYPDQRLGLGLTSMRERVEASGGTMKTVARPGQGVIIRCAWELEDEEPRIW